MTQIQNKKEVLHSLFHNIISNPQYNVVSDEYLNATFIIYYLSTLNPAELITDPNINPFFSPFENTFLLIREFIDDEMNKLKNGFSSAENGIQLCMSHLDTIKKRLKIINHICRYIDKKRHTFIQKPRQSKVSQIISLYYFSFFEPYFDQLIKIGVNEFKNAFTKDDIIPNFSILINLNYLCQSASKSIETNPEQFSTKNWKNLDLEYFLSKFTHQINEVFHSGIEKVPVERLSHISNYIYSLLAQTTISQTTLYNIFYESAIKTREKEFNSLISNKSPLEILRNHKNYPNEISSITVLSFHDNSIEILTPFFTKFVDEISQTISKESSLKQIGTQLLQFLDDVAFFNSIIYEKSYNINENNKKAEFIQNLLTIVQIRFNQIKLNHFSNFKFMIAQLFDSFFKLGGIDVPTDKLIQLFKYVTDRDVLISYHTDNLFLRVTTRSFKNLKLEEDFIQRIALFISRTEVLERAQSIIAQAKNEETEIVNGKSFGYLSINRQFAPIDQQYPLLPLPPEYLNFIDIAQKKLMAKAECKYEWIHYLTTVEMKIKANNTVSKVYMSLGQYIVYALLSKNQSITFSRLVEASQIDSSYLEIILSSLAHSKCVIIQENQTETSDDKEEQLKTSTIALNPKFPQARKMYLCDNWSPKLDKLKPIDQKQFTMQRSKSVQGIIVKLMKKFKMIKPSQLIEAAINEVSKLFPIAEENIASCIRTLISDDYIEETADGQLSYIE